MIPIVIDASDLFCCLVQPLIIISELDLCLGVAADQLCLLGLQMLSESEILQHEGLSSF